MIKRLTALLKIIVVLILLIAILYIVSLSFPNLLLRNNIREGNLILYSDASIPKDSTLSILREVNNRIVKSSIYRDKVEHKIYVIQNPILWKYFTNINYNVGGLNYVIFNHSIFIRNSDISDNRVIGPSGNKVGLDRTLDYYITHEITHTLEFQSMPFYKYPLETNWIIEGYAEYIGHNSENYEIALNKYLNVEENSKAKYYTQVRVMTAYLIEKRGYLVSDLWKESKNFEDVKKQAIPIDTPTIGEVY